MSPLLAAFRVQARYWRRHRLQALLCGAGIVLGVAVFSAIRMANRGALEAFAEGVTAFAGSATHRVYAPAGGGVPEGLYPRLALAPGVRAATPVLRARVRVPGAQPLELTVLGIDPVSDATFRSFTFLPAGGQAGASATGLLERFLAEPDAVALPEALARRLGLQPGDALTVKSARGPQRLRVRAVFRPPAGQRAAFGRTAVMDIAAHQEHFGELGRLDAIRLIVAPGAEAGVRALLPAGVALEAAGGRVQRVERMSRAFRLNLQVLGSFALLVAMFLVFNAASFSVAQREATLAMLRCIGAPARTVFAALLGEALLVGALGATLGVLLGRWLGALMLRNTGATLFEVVLRVEPQPAAATLDARTWTVGLALGMGVSVLGAAWPAWQGARVSPLAAVQGARQPGARRFPVGRWAGAGALTLAAAAGLLWAPGGSLAAGLAGATALALGMAALCPGAAALLSRLGARPLSRLAGAPGRLAARNLGRSLNRTGIAAAALMIALALALSIEITVRSFKRTFELWLEQAVTADLYLEPAREADEGPPLDAALRARLAALPEVEDLAVLRSRRVVLGGREVLVLAVDLPAYARHSTLPPVGMTPAAAYARLADGAAFVSETLAWPLGLAAGDRLRLPTPRGETALTVGAVVQNYSAPQGLIYLSLERFSTLFGPAAPHRAALWLRPGADAEALRTRLEAMPALAGLAVAPHAALRADALRVFDRTFAITDVMGTLAAFVAFMAVVSALTALLEERMRTLGYLRAIGVSRRALGASMALEAALLAGVAACVSWATGVAMAWVLVFVVNRRAFGWTLQFLPAQGSYGGLLALALAAALLGSAWPIWRATRLSVTATIREE